MQDDDATTNANASARGALDLLLGGFDRREFFDGYWEQRSLYLAHDDRDRFAHLLNRERFVKEDALGCDRLSAHYDDADGRASEMDALPDQVRRLFDAGMMIVAPELPRTRAREEFIESFGKDVFPSAPVHLSASYSPTDTGRGLHCCAQPRWLMQVEGRRHCRVSREPAVRNPGQDLIFPPDRDRVELAAVALRRPDVDNPDEFWSVTLEPGDVIYAPAGVWQWLRADGYSLGLALDAARVTAFDMLLTVLQHSLAAPEFKVLAERIEGMDAARVDNGKLSDDLEAVLAERLAVFKGLVSRIELANVHKAFEHLSTAAAVQMLKAQSLRKI